MYSKILIIPLIQLISTDNIGENDIIEKLPRIIIIVINELEMYRNLYSCEIIIIYLQFV